MPWRRERLPTPVFWPGELHGLYSTDLWLAGTQSISTLAWKIPWTEEPGKLQSMGSRRVRHDWATLLSLFTFIGEGNGNPLQCSCLENPRDGGAWWAAVYGVAQSWTRLKQLSSSSKASECVNSHKVLTMPASSNVTLLFSSQHPSPHLLKN